MRAALGQHVDRGGTDTGVMRLVGQAIANYALDNVTAGAPARPTGQPNPPPPARPPPPPTSLPQRPTLSLTLTRWASARGAPSPIATSLTPRRAAPS